MIVTNPDKLKEWQSSLSKARQEKVRAWETVRLGWRAHSSGSKEIYSLKTIQLDNGCTGIACDCYGYIYHNYCKHTARLAIILHNRGERIRLP